MNIEFETFDDTVNDHQQTLLFATLDGITCAFATFNYRRAPMCKLQRLKVSESMQGKGIGRDMLQVIEDHARANGCERVSLTVHPDSDVQPFYECCGYEWSYIHECGATEMGKQL